jgi:HK97 family phage portal protein
MRGDSFWVLERNGKKVPAEIWPVPSTWVIDWPSSGNPFYKIKMGSSANPKPIPVEDVLWFKEPDPNDPYGRGAGVVQSLADEVDTDENAAKHVKSFFYNRAVPDAIISVDGADQPSLDGMKARFDANHRGSLRAHRNMFVGQKIDYTKISTDFSDLELVPLRQFERDTIIQVFGVPPELLGILENSNRATIETADLLFAKHVLSPRLDKLREELQNKLVPMFDDRLIIDYEEIVPEDMAFKLEAMKALPFIADIAEARDLIGLPERETGIDAARVFTSSQVLQNTETGEVTSFAPVAPAFPAANGDSEPANTDEEPATKSKGAPTGARFKAPEDLGEVLDSVDADELTTRLDPIWEERVSTWGDEVLADLGLNATFSMLNPKVVEHLRAFSGNKIVGINDTTKEKLRASLVEGVQAGDSIPDLAKRVSDVFDEARGSRAVTIARTEVIGSSNFATQSAYEQSGVVEARRWISTPDDRTRDTHLALNGEEVPLNEPFSVGGASAMYPGGSGVAEEDINCRCTVVAVIKDKAKDGEVWKAFDRKALAWEREAKAALRDGFDSQEEAVLRKLGA